MKMTKDNFAVYITTHERAEEQLTLDTLRRQGYTGKIFLVVDNEDPQLSQYKDRFKDMVVTFDKRKAMEKSDTMFNKRDRPSPLFARNWVLKEARKGQYCQGLIIDDDIKSMDYRYEDHGKLRGQKVTVLDKVFESLMDFMNESGVNSVGFAVADHFFGGLNSDIVMNRITPRLYNDYFFNEKSDFEFVGFHTEDLVSCEINENTGTPLWTICDICLSSPPVGTSEGGMAATYDSKWQWANAFLPLMARPDVGGIKLNKAGNEWRDSVPKSNVGSKVISGRWKK